MGMTMLVVFWFFRPFVSGTGETIGLIMIFLAVGAPVTYWLTKPERAGPPES